ncbi:hypothetical protein HMPREF9946_03655 [Acetobacteraceae bacterium AT-5844]|nr:hypothetical protein HMPREF9946_03655 [Acetobacteraceae bacterium AT-5844]
MSRPATSVFVPRGLRQALGCAGLLAATLMGGTAQAQEDGSFNLTNRSNRVIERLYASPVDTNQWGENRLRSGQTIANGASFAVRMPESGGCRTDLRIGFAGGVVEERRDIDTCVDRDVVIGTPARTGRGNGGSGSSGGAGGTVEGGAGGSVGGRSGGAEQGSPTFVIINQAASPINEVYASPTSDDNWGQDRLGENIVRPRGRQTIRLPNGDCQYDLRVVWQDGRSEERRNINLCEMRELTVR